MVDFSVITTSASSNLLRENTLPLGTCLNSHNSIRSSRSTPKISTSWRFRLLNIFSIFILCLSYTTLRFFPLFNCIQLHMDMPLNISNFCSRLSYRSTLVILVILALPSLFHPEPLNEQKFDTFIHLSVSSLASLSMVGILDTYVPLMLVVVIIYYLHLIYKNIFYYSVLCICSLI